MFDYLTSSGPRRENGYATGIVISVLWHLGVLALLVWAGRTAELSVAGTAGTAFGPGLSGSPGTGGEQVTFFEIGASAPAPQEAPPSPSPVPPEPVTQVVPTQPDEFAMPVPSVVGGAQGVVRGSGIGGAGPSLGPGLRGGSGGVGGGTGSGTGTGGGDAVAGGIRPPVAIGVIIPPAAPALVRGRTVVLRISVDSRGQVRDAELLSSTGDRSFDARLEQTAREWRFEPARDAANRPVDAQTEISFIF